ncbi:hypothetical protein [Streptomyces sp. BE20]|uniref:hypothetical protein n=1 Tax=Streptomycetaceae TaxID=2062 RepID=UPI002E791BE4|nr:hypothetical protein [Streptomyces sp. BE20]MEE1826141.1 hypothetical protein [Streptomyces sp. BE20]
MEAEVVQLVTAGASTLVGLMATEFWTQARSRFGSWLGRGEGDEAEEAALERSRAAVTRAQEAGDTRAVEDLTGGWRARLREALHENPAAARELEALLEEFGPRLPKPAAGSLNIAISGGTVQGSVIQAGTAGSVTIGRTDP